MKGYSMPLWRSSNQPSTRSKRRICWLAEPSPLPSTTASRASSGACTATFSSSVSVGRRRAKAPGDDDTALNTRAASWPLRKDSPSCAVSGTAQRAPTTQRTWPRRSQPSVSAGKSRAAQTSACAGKNTGSDSAQAINGARSSAA